jgi:hypothetical protein
MRTRALLVAVVTLVLSACAPTTASDDRVDVLQLTDPITYYPFQTGAAWEYLQQGARLTDPRTTVVVEGPTVIDNGVWIGWRLIGPAREKRSYRQVTPAGVFLHSEIRLGITTLTYDPPIQEYPPEGVLRVGALWSGETDVTLQLHDGTEPEVRHLAYTYTVVDRRTVTIPAGSVEVFVINLTSRLFDDDGMQVDEETYETWFAPFVGEVRLNTGHVLMRSNVPALTEAPGGGGG